MVQVLFSSLKSTALFLIGVLSAAPLLCVFTPSLLLRSFSLPDHPPPPSLFGQFNHGTLRPRLPSYFIRLLYSGEKYSFIRFLSVSFTLLLCLPPLVPCLLLSLSLVKPKPTWQITALFHGAPPKSLVKCRRISLPRQQLEQSSTTIKRPPIISQ